MIDRSERATRLAVTQGGFATPTGGGVMLDEGGEIWRAVHRVSTRDGGEDVLFPWLHAVQRQRAGAPEAELLRLRDALAERLARAGEARAAALLRRP